MTIADKTDILNLVKDASALARAAVNANAPYRDTSVVEYANDAIRDAESVRDFVESVLRDNIGRFLDLSCIRIGGGEWGYKEVEAFGLTGDFHVRICECFYATMHLGSWKMRNDKPQSRDEMYVSADAKDITVEDVYVQCSNPFVRFADWEYADISIRDLVERGDIFYRTGTYYSLWEDHTPDIWNYIREMAFLTRVKSSFLVYSLKKSLARVVDGLRDLANERIHTREENSRTGEYQPVGL